MIKKTFVSIGYFDSKNHFNVAIIGLDNEEYNKVERLSPDDIIYFATNELEKRLGYSVVLVNYRFLGQNNVSFYGCEEEV